MLRKKLPFVILLMMLTTLLAGCIQGIPVSIAGPQTVETAAYATVSAYMTQSAFETLVGELTEVATGGQPEEPVQTEQPGETPADVVPSATLQASATSTALPPTATNTAVPTSTAVPTLTPAPATPTPIPCYRVQFVSDVTVPDDTTFAPNQGFVKTWRLRNSGSCTWTPDFDLVFNGGNAMSAPAVVDINATVRPNETVDVSVSLTAPSSAGSYTGYWMLRSGNGVLFGLGQNADKPFWVRINVVVSSPGSWDSNHKGDFAYNYCAAVWRSGAGVVSCPSNDNYSTGSVNRTSTPVLESGYVDDEMALIAIPNSGDGGHITGEFPALMVEAGDHFYALVGCMNGATNCDVTFELLYRIKGSNSSPTSLGTWGEKNEGLWTQINVDLSSLAGSEVEFSLKVRNNGSNNDDRVFWLAPTIR